MRPVLDSHGINSSRHHIVEEAVVLHATVVESGCLFTFVERRLEIQVIYALSVLLGRFLLLLKKPLVGVSERAECTPQAESGLPSAIV